MLERPQPPSNRERGPHRGYFTLAAHDHSHCRLNGLPTNARADREPTPVGP
jgi:hypothetical protein